MELTAPKKHVEFDFIFNQIFKEDLRDYNENLMLNLEKPTFKDMEHQEPHCESSQLLWLNQILIDFP